MSAKTSNVEAKTKDGWTFLKAWASRTVGRPDIETASGLTRRTLPAQTESARND